MSEKSIHHRTIFRKAHNQENPYALISKKVLRDSRLSCKAMGLMCYFLSLPDDWQINISEVIGHFSNGEKSIRAGIKELTSLGYIEKVQERNEKGHFLSTTFLVYEEPSVPNEPPALETHEPTPHSGFGNAGNRRLLSTDGINTKINNNRYLGNTIDKTPKPVTAQGAVVDEIKKMNPDLKISASQLKKWVDTHGETYVLEKVRLMLDAKPDSPEKFLNSAIKFNWLPPTQPQTNGETQMQPISKIYTRAENRDWFESLTDEEKKNIYTLHIASDWRHKPHFESANVRPWDEGFSNHWLFSYLMDHIGRCERGLFQDELKNKPL